MFPLWLIFQEPKVINPRAICLYAFSLFSTTPLERKKLKVSQFQGSSPMVSNSSAPSGTVAFAVFAPCPRGIGIPQLGNRCEIQSVTELEIFCCVNMYLDNSG